MPDANPSPDKVSLPRLGSYKIVCQLGSGGMSSVYKALHEESGSLVALKVLPRTLAQNPILLQRFLREAQSAEHLDHPNIVAIYDRGFDQGRHYLVLEYVEGNDLADRVRAQGPLDAARVVSLTREVALALRYAAAQGMIHRDIKPANLLITSEGKAKVIDLGLALNAEDEDERVTRDGTTVGTVDYMSPEQARDSRKINERSDIYSLGCTLHFLVTGFAPFPGGTLADKLARHHSAAIPDVRDRNPAIPRDLAALIQKMMAKKPEQRHASYDDLLRHLDRLGSDALELAPESVPDVLIDEDEDEDDDDDVVELTIAEDSPTSKADRSSGSRIVSSPTVEPQGFADGLSLADLAELDDSVESPRSPRRRTKTASTTETLSPVLSEAIFEVEDDSGVIAVRRGGDELPLQTWIAAGVMVGVVIAMIGFGVRFALSFGGSPDEPGGPATITQPLAVDEATDPQPTAENRNVASPPEIRPKSTQPDLAQREATDRTKPTPQPSSPPATVAASLDSVRQRMGLVNRTDPPPPVLSGRVVVHRLADLNDPKQTSSLVSAFDRAQDEVVLGDQGPLIEDNFEMAGKARTIRAVAGIRPILKVEFTSQPLVRDQEAKFVLGGKGVEQLLIEGVDLIVDVRDFAAHAIDLVLVPGR